MTEMLLRFLIGGSVVSCFAVLGDMVKPESLGGIFAAAPTIALATVILSMRQHGGAYVAMQSRSMVARAVAFFVCGCGQLRVDALATESDESGSHVATPLVCDGRTPLGDLA
jgi:hypothetical protein